VTDVVVVGGANFDIKAKVNGRHLFGTSNPGTVHTAFGGVGRNVAHNLVKLGHRVRLISAFGDDYFGRVLRDATAASGVDLSLSLDTRLPTGTYVATLDGTGELIGAVSAMAIMDVIDDTAIEARRDHLDAARYVVADCNLSEQALAKLAAFCGHKLIVDPVSVAKAQRLFSVLARHRIFMATPNLDQIETLTGNRDINQALAVVRKLGLDNVVIHMGPEGAVAWDGEVVEHVEPNLAGAVVDVTGAGDAAVAGLVHGLLNGVTIAEAAALGQSCAGRVVCSHASTLE
jgi:pseudouridine kinase